MRIHRNIAEAAARTLTAIFEGGEVAERAVARTIEEQPKWGKRDRSFFAETVFEVVRWKEQLIFLGQANASWSDTPWQLLATHWVRKGVELPVWEEFAGFPVTGIVERETALATAPRWVRESLPQWLDARGESELGEAWSHEIAALNQEAPIFVRANSLKNSRDELQATLREQNIESSPVEGAPDALQLAAKFLAPRWLQSGVLEIQDAASQQVAPFLRIGAGQLIVDACAGAGGKTLHMAALSENRSDILALDVVGAKLATLQKRAARAGASRIQTAPVSPKLLAQWKGKADRVLIDAPCSGLGTLRRQPDLKWRLSEEFLFRLQATQAQVLRDYSALLKPGGLMVYATCSILPSENETQVARFLEGNPDFKLVESRSISPAQSGWDGFFMALLTRH